MNELKKEIPELLEILEALFCALFVLKKHFKDGVQSDDFLKIAMDYFKDDEFRAKFKKAVDGAYKVPTEVKDAIRGLKFNLVVELVKYLIFNVKNLFAKEEVKELK